VEEVHPIVAQRRLLHAAIEEAIRADPDLDGHVCSGFLVVFEAAGADGMRWLCSRSGDALGESDLTPWAADGMVRYALEQGFFGADEEIGDEG
jgi:hypothetical protein